MAETVYLGFGSNLGDREQNLRSAMAAVARYCEKLKVSSFVESAAAFKEDQPDFMNAVAAFSSSLDPLALLCLLQSIEYKMGRRRKQRNEPRVIDIDILCYGEAILEKPNLVVPHPGIFERDFVLTPLKEIAPDFVHPVTGVAIASIDRSTLAGQIIQKSA